MPSIPFTSPAPAVAGPIPAPTLAPSPLVSAGVSSPSTITGLRSFMSPAVAGSNTDTILGAIATGDDYVKEQTLKVFNQLFLSSASGVYLDQRASDVGISRILDSGLSDDAFRAIALTYKNSQLTLNALLQLLESLYGEKATKAHLNLSPNPLSVSGYYVLADGGSLVIEVDSRETITIVFDTADFSNIALARPEEVAFAINKEFKLKNTNAYAKVEYDTLYSTDTVLVFSKTIGVSGSIRLVGGSTLNSFLTSDITARNTLQTTGTTFTIGVGSDSETMRLTWTGGTDPLLSETRVGDFLQLYEPIFNEENSGSWKITKATNTYVEAVNPTFLNQSVSLASAADLLFFKANKRTVYDNENYAIATESRPSFVNVVVPPVSELIARTTTTGGYLANNVFEEIISSPNARNALGIITVNVNSYSDLAIDDWILVDGLASEENSVSVTDTGGFLNAGGDMNAARESHTAIVLGDGRVLAVGGNSGAAVLASSEVSDSTIDTWTNSGSLTTGRHFHSMIELDSGNILVIGGYTDLAKTTATATCEIYDPDVGVWAVVGSMSVARAELGCCKLRDGRILVAGGHATNDNIEIFDPTTNSWSLATPTLVEGGRRGCACTLINDGRVVISTGELPVGDYEYEIYSPWLDELQSIAYSTGNNAINHKAFFIDGYADAAGSILFIGGENSPTTVNIFEQSKLVFNEDHLNFTIGREGHTATMMDDNQILVVGGVGTAAENSLIIDAKSGDLAASFKPTKGFASNTLYNHAAVKLSGNRVLILGGHTGASTISECVIYTYNKVTRSGRANGLFKVTNVLANNVSFDTRLASLGEFSNGSTVYNPTIYGVRALDNDIGSFVYDPLNGLSVTVTDTTTTTALESGRTYESIEVADTTGMPDSGFVAINYGWQDQIGPLAYSFKPNSTTLILKSGFTFPSTVAVGSTVTLLLGNDKFVPENPNLNGALYVTASTSVTSACYDLLKEIMAAGVKYDIAVEYPSAVGLGNSHSPTFGLGKISDLVRVYAGNGIEDALEKARED